MRTVAWGIALGYPYLKVKTEALSIMSSMREVHEETADSGPNPNSPSRQFPHKCFLDLIPLCIFC